MIQCSICNTKTNHILTDTLRLGNGKVYYCKQCDLGFLENMILDTKEYYNNQYRNEYSHSIEKKTINAEEIFNAHKNEQKEKKDLLSLPKDIEAGGPGSIERQEKQSSGPLLTQPVTGR